MSEESKPKEGMMDELFHHKHKDGEAPKEGAAGQEQHKESRREKFEDHMQKDAQKEANDDIWGGGGGGVNAGTAAGNSKEYGLGV